jgi:hypothetical protein
VADRSRLRPTFYALGVLLYVLLTGQHPCGEITSPVDLLKAIVDTDPSPPSAVAVAGKTPVTDPAIRAANARGLIRA